MNPVLVVAVLATIQFFVFSFLTGRARAKSGVRAPAIVGDEQFERAFRVQMNTLEQLVCFLPALLIAGRFWSPTLVSLLGVVYLAGRLVYRRAYLMDPSKRVPGFLLSVVPTFLLLIAALAGALIGTPVSS